MTPQTAAMPIDRSFPQPLNSLFGCLRVLCDHHGVSMSLTPEALEALAREREGLAAAEAALVEAGFRMSHTRLDPETLRLPGQSFPILAERREGGYVLVIGVADGGGQGLIGVFDPEAGEERARPWTPDLVTTALAEEALHPVPVHAARPSRGPEAAVSGPRNSEERTHKRKDTMTDIYADAFENILVHGGVVRIDLASYSPKEKGGGDEPALELTGRLVMPVEGFVRAFGGIGEVVRQMVEAGVIEPIEGSGPGGGRITGGHA